LIAAPWLGAVLLAAAPDTPAAATKWEAPAAERARANPVPATPEALLKAQALYQKHCASCHGDKGKGDGPADTFNTEQATDLTDPAVQSRLTDGEILWKITKGRRSGPDVVMPGIANRVLLEEDRWKLVLFVRSLGRPSP
jgi:mono/diheme cytochrome c family protein